MDNCIFIESENDLFKVENLQLKLCLINQTMIMHTFLEVLNYWSKKRYNEEDKSKW